MPGTLAVAALMAGVKEPKRPVEGRRSNPIQRENMAQLDSPYWWVVIIGAVFTLARFSEAFLVLKAQRSGIAMALVPLVIVAMNLVHSVSAHPFGKLFDRVNHTTLLAMGLLILIASDIVLANAEHWAALLAGVALWGIHMSMTQGLLAPMVADTALSDLRGTAFGFFNLLSGVPMLVVSGVAGWLWDRHGSAMTCLCGAAFAGVAMLGLIFRKAYSLKVMSVERP